MLATGGEPVLVSGAHIRFCSRPDDEAPFLQKMMRHSAITTTLRYYSSRDAADAGAHIDAAFHRSMPAAVTQGDGHTLNSSSEVTL